MRNALALCVALLLFPSCAAPGAARNSAQDGDSLEDVFHRVHRSVVTIRTVAKAASLEQTGRVVTEEGLGSGTLISDDGRVLTAAHVVQTADKVEVEFFDGTRIPAKVVGSDPVTDLALVQLDRAPLRSAAIAPLGDSDASRIGSRVFVVGAPLGIGHTLTVGHLSARRLAPSFVGSSAQVEVFQTDAAINPGNSGGPLFNMSGEVIGVVSYIVSETGGSQGLGFAITSKTTKERLLERHPFWSGMTYVYLSGRLAELFNLPDGASGMLVQRVAANSPGERLGVRGGDIAAEISGQPILLGGDVVLEVLGMACTTPGGNNELYARYEALGPDDELELLVLRGGQRVRLGKKLSELR